MVKPIFKILLLSFAFLAIVGVTFLAFQKNTYNKVLAEVRLPGSTPAPIPQTFTTKVDSPDGKVTLTMTLQNGNATKIYTFTSDKINFTKTVPVTSTLSIPFNTWSPDDKYVFIKEDTGSTTNFYLEPADVNISEKFLEAHPDTKIQDMTGWAAPNLIIINGNNGTTDVSYWFDLTSQTFIRLSNRFN